MTIEGDREDPKDPGSEGDPGEKAPAEKTGEEGKGEEKKAPTAEERIAALEAEREELRNVAKGALKKAADAETFVSTITSRLADRAGERPAERTDPNEVRDRVREAISEDPISVLDQHYDARTRPLVNRFLEQQGTTNRQLFIARLSASEDGRELLKDYLEDVDTFMKDFGPEHRAAEDSYDAALRWVRAKPDNFKKEVARAVAREREKEKAHFVEPATAGERGPKEKKRSLSDIEKTVAQGLGLTDEEYLQYKED